jgi:hypothetical protein
MVFLFTVFTPTKLISSSKSAGAIQVNFLYCPLNSWHCKSANKLLPLSTNLFLYNSICHQCLSYCFLLLNNMWCTNMKAALATCTNIFPPGAVNTGGSQHTASLPECVPTCPNLNLGASKTLRDYVMLLRCSRMLKCVCGLRMSASLPPFSLCDFVACARITFPVPFTQNACMCSEPCGCVLSIDFVTFWKVV